MIDTTKDIVVGLGGIARYSKCLCSRRVRGWGGGVGAAAIRAEAIDGGDNGWVKRDGFGSPYHLNGFVTI